MSEVKGVGGCQPPPHVRAAQSEAQKTELAPKPENALPPSMRPDQPPPAAAIKVASAHVTSRLDTLVVIEDPLAAGLRVAIMSAFDPGELGDSVRWAMANADPGILRESLQMPRADGKSAWDRMDAHTQDLIASDRPRRAAAFQSFIIHPLMDGLVKLIKRSPGGEEAGRLMTAVVGLTDGEAERAADAIRAVDERVDPVKSGAEWASSFHGHVMGPAAASII